MTEKEKQEVLELSHGKKMKVVLVIDEASLLRLPVFAELHTLTQFENDSKPFLPLILTGQNNLVENLRFRDSLPLSSRVVAKKHLQSVDREAMEKYLDHHQALAGVKTSLFEEGAVTAIHQGAGGFIQESQSSGQRRNYRCCKRRTNKGNSRACAPCCHRTYVTQGEQYEYLRRRTTGNKTQ